MRSICGKVSASSMAAQGSATVSKARCRVTGSAGATDSTARMLSRSRRAVPGEADHGAVDAEIGEDAEGALQAAELLGPADAEPVALAHHHPQRQRAPPPESRAPDRATASGRRARSRARLRAGPHRRPPLPARRRPLDDDFENQRGIACFAEFFRAASPSSRAEPERAPSQSPRASWSRTVSSWIRRVFTPSAPCPRARARCRSGRGSRRRRRSSSS